MSENKMEKKINIYIYRSWFLNRLCNMKFNVPQKKIGILMFNFFCNGNPNTHFANWYSWRKGFSVEIY